MHQDQIESVPLIDEERKQLRASLMTPGRMLKDILIMPLALFMFTAFSAIPAGLVALVLVGVGAVLGVNFLDNRITLGVLLVLWLGVAVVANYFVFRSSVPEYRARFARNAPLKSDLAGGVKQCESLRIEEALCVQEDEHKGLGYFCRVADGRVIFELDYGSQSWEDEDLAEGYRRGVDPRQEKFLPAEHLRLCWAPASGMIFEEAFSRARVPLVEGIYWTDVTKLPESGTFIKKSWPKVVAQYKRDKRRVDWTELLQSVGMEAA